MSLPPSEGEWDFYWCDVSWLRENFDHTYMDEHVRICHFRNHYEVSRAGQKGPNPPTQVTGCGGKEELVWEVQGPGPGQESIRGWRAQVRRGTCGLEC